MENNNFKLTDIKSLEQLRDELKVQAHLFKAEAKDHWEKLEKDWHRFVGEFTPAKRAVAETSDEVRSAANLLLGSLRDGYEKIKLSMTH